jgi:xylose isomerase
VVDRDLRPTPVSGRQEQLEGVVNRYVERLA